MDDLVSIARSQPQCVVWDEPDDIQLVKTTSNKLGIKIQTLKIPDGTYTIVTRCLPDCVTQQGHLVPGSRIISVDGEIITNLTASDIQRILAATRNVVFLTVCRAVGIHSENNGTNVCTISNGVQSLRKDEVPSDSQGNHANRSSSGSDSSGAPPSVKGRYLAKTNSNGSGYSDENVQSFESIRTAAHFSINPEQSCSVGGNSCQTLSPDSFDEQRPQFSIDSSRNRDNYPSSQCSLNMSPRSSDDQKPNLSNQNEYHKDQSCNHELSASSLDGCSSQFSIEVLPSIDDSLLPSDSISPDILEGQRSQFGSALPPNITETQRSQLSNEMSAMSYSSPMSQNGGSDENRPQCYVDVRVDGQRAHYSNHLSPRRHDAPVALRTSSNRGSPPLNTDGLLASTNPSIEPERCVLLPDAISQTSSVNLTMNEPGVHNPRIVHRGSHPRADAVSYEDLISVALKSPNYVLWDPNTLKLELPNIYEGKRVIGFKSKVKQGRTEIYSLVESVESSSSAHGILRPGDWIRSVNGQPLHEKKMAMNIKRLIKENKEPSLTLIVQRPQALTSTGLRTLRRPYESTNSVLTSCPTVPSVEGSISITNPIRIRPMNPVSTPFEPAIQQLFNRIVSKALRRSIKCLPRSRVFVLGRNSDLLARNLLGGIVNEPSTSYRLYNLYKRTIQVESNSDQIQINPQNEDISVLDEHLASQVAQEFFNSPEVDRTTRTKISYSLLTSGIKEMHGIDTQLLGKFLKDQEAIDNELIDFGVVSLCDSPLSESCAHAMFTQNSQFVLTFDVEQFHANTTAVMDALCDQLTKIRCYAGSRAQIILACCGRSTPIDSLHTITRKLEDAQMLSCVTSQLVYNRQTNLPLFYIDLDKSHDRTHDIVQLQQAVINYAVHTCLEFPLELPVCSLAFCKRLKALRQEGDQVIARVRAFGLLKSIIGPCDEDILHLVLEYMHQTGEIIYQGACVHRHDNSPVLETALYINTELLIDHACNLFTIPNKSEQDPKWRSAWERLSKTGMASEQFIIECILKNCIEAKHVLACFQLHHLVYQTANGFLLPHYLPKSYESLFYSPSLNSLVSEGQTLFICFKEPPYVSALVRLLISCMDSCYNANGSVEFMDKSSAIFRQNGYEFLIKCLQSSGLVEVHIRSSERDLHHFFNWFQNIVHSSLCLPPDSYHIGPSCPASQCIMGDQQHVLDLKGNRPMHCGIEKVDSHPMVSQWFAGHMVRHPFERSPSSELTSLPTSMGSLSSDPMSVNTLIRKIHPDLATLVTSMLNIPMVLGRDWRKLAVLRGLSIGQIELLKTKPDPCLQLLHDWGTTSATIQNLLDLMIEMERLDVHSDVIEWMEKHGNKGDTVAKVE